MASKYEPLHAHLSTAAKRGDDSIQLAFDRIDELVGGLPFSARNYREWWSNSSQPHAWAWRDAGWNVAVVSQTAGTVRFERDRASPQVSRPQVTPHPRSPPSRSSRTARVQVDVQSLPIAGQTEVRVSAEWRDAGPVTLDFKGELCFPQLPKVPGLYRMTLADTERQKRPRIYVGETDDLRRRVTHYRNPGPSQDTNLRMNAVLKAHLGGGGTARLAIAAAAHLHVEGAAPTPLDLTRKAPRLLAENAALVLAQLDGGADIENLG